MSDFYPKDKLGASIVPGRTVAFALSSYKSLNIARVVNVEPKALKRWTSEGQKDYTGYDVTIQSRRFNYRDRKYEWGPSRVASWHDMIVLDIEPEDIEVLYRLDHNAEE